MYIMNYSFGTLLTRYVAITYIWFNSC